MPDRIEPPRLRLAHACGSPVVSPSSIKESSVIEVPTDGSPSTGEPRASETTQLTSSAMSMHTSTTDSESLFGVESGKGSKTGWVPTSCFLTAKRTFSWHLRHRVRSSACHWLGANRRNHEQRSRPGSGRYNTCSRRTSNSLARGCAKYSHWSHTRVSSSPGCKNQRHKLAH